MPSIPFMPLNFDFLVKYAIFWGFLRLNGPFRFFYCELYFWFGTMIWNYYFGLLVLTVIWSYYLGLLFRTVITNCYFEILFGAVISNCCFELLFRTVICSCYLKLLFGTVVWNCCLELLFATVIWKYYLELLFKMWSRIVIYDFKSYRLVFIYLFQFIFYLGL